MSTRSSGPVQSRRLGLLQQHPLACFFVLTYSAAWFLWIGNFPGTPKGRHAVLAIGPTAKPSTGRPPGTAWRSSDAFVSTAMMKTVEPQQPGYLPHSEAVAAPMDRLTQRKALVVGHRPQSLPSAAPRPGREHRVRRARSAPRPPDLRAGGPARRVLCAGPPGHLTLSAAPPASPTADSSHLPYRHRPFTQP